MNRRKFLKFAGAAGLGLTTPFWLSGRPRANEPASFDGPFYVIVKAQGGWDPTELTDPKGGSINRSFGDADFLQSGNITYAPRTAGPMTNREFFERHYREMVVFNGVDHGTNNHLTGKRTAGTGELEKDTYPTFGALIAASKAPDVPVSYLTFGGYSKTADLVPLSRIDRPSRIADLAQYEYIDPDTRYHTPGAAVAIDSALSSARDEALMRRHLPSEETARSLLLNSQQSATQLRMLSDELAQIGDVDLNNARSVRAQAAVALASFKAGLCVTASLDLGGFDSHSDHDSRQLPRIGQLLDGVDYLLRTAETLGIRDKVIVLMTSDFGRTPRYNDKGGKDHWPVGTTIVIGNGTNIQGNRVVGATDGGQKRRKLNLETLAIDDDGVTLTQAHLHATLRDFAGVDQALAERFPLPVEPVPALLTG